MKKRNRTNFICGFSFSILLFTLVSCTPQLKNNIEGVWIVDSIFVDSINIRNRYLSANILVLERNNSFQAPTLEMGSPFVKGVWRLQTLEKKSYVLFESRDMVFNGLFFIIPDSNYSSIKLISETFTINCTRANSL